MAIVFISPKKKQRMFFTGITVGFLIFIFSVSFIVFLSKPKITPEDQFSINPKININFKALESEEIQYVQLMDKMEKSFSYEAKDEKNEIKTGVIVGISKDEAKKVLESAGLTIVKLEEAKTGRDNPFIPYYGAVQNAVK